MTIHREQVRNQLKATAELFFSSDRFLLLTHEYPDGDALGSMLALGEGLKSLGKQVTMYSEGLIPEIYGFLPGLSDIANDPGRLDEFQIVVLIDCHELHRAGDRFLHAGSAPILAVIDHHLADKDFPSHAVVDARASASGELIFYLLNEMGLTVTKDIAVNLFVAISTDTGSFSYENTTPGALEVVAKLVAVGAKPWDIFRHLNFNRSPARMSLLGQTLSGMEYFHQGQVGVMTITLEMMKSTKTTAPDTDGFVEYPRWVKGVELAVLVRETGPKSCKVSLRSLGRVNAAALAQAFGGGGHFNAAGFIVDEPVDKLKNLLIMAIVPYLPTSKIKENA
ncbi:MAG: bifunctional oligoribonuclease/PAP phosphatase NrnA [Deltaproteobacteria bacterium]|nr:bifunctional oligoribonuclease/PAP phosphatase NrnA [Deltaproteobacteria bacterium]